MAENIEKNEYEDDYADEEDTQKDMYLTFHLGSEDYGIPIAYVTEIIGIQKITEVPDMPEFVKGVINLRGKVIPVIDLRSRFAMELLSYGDRTCIIVVNINDMAIGLVVDKVTEVANIPEDRVEPPPSILKNSLSKYIQGIGKLDDRVKILLDMNKLLLNGELTQIDR